MMTTLAAAPSLQAPPSPQEGHATPRAGGARPFAELLRKNQTPTAPASASASAPAPAPAPSASANEDEAPEAADAGKPQAAQKTRPRNPAAQTAQQPLKADGRAKAEVVSAGSKAAEQTAPTEQATDPALAQWLADLHLPPAVKAETASAKDADADAATAAADSGTDKAARVSAAKAEDLRGASDARQLAAEKAEAAHGAGDPGGLVQQEKRAAAEGAAAPEHSKEGGVSRSEPGASPTGIVGAPLLTATTPPGATQAPVDIALATPLTAPDFAEALGAQVSMFARNGVHRAELHLNPAEMGPVSVQIVLDGTQAHVDFGSDVAATRHAIEAGLPELAGALRDAGLTLSGGGVSQHSRGRSDGDGSAAHGARKGRVDPIRSTEPVRPLQQLGVAGGVDLYA